MIGPGVVAMQTWLWWASDARHNACHSENNGMGWIGRREAMDWMMLVTLALSGVCMAGNPVCTLLTGGVMACVVIPGAACVIGVLGVRSLARKAARYGPTTRTAYALRRIGWTWVAGIVLWQAIRWAFLTRVAAESCTPW